MEEDKNGCSTFFLTCLGIAAVFYVGCFLFRLVCEAGSYLAETFWRSKEDVKAELIAAAAPDRQTAETAAPDRQTADADAPKAEVSLPIAVEPPKPKIVPKLPDAKNVFVLIAANETYRAYGEFSAVPNVPLAGKDAEAVRRHCVETLGIPEENCYVVKDFTRSRLLRQLKNFCRHAKTSPNAKIVFYYVGHGFPAKQGGGETANLLPVDVDPADADEYSVPLKNVFARLAETGAKRIVVFLDAAFSDRFSGDSRGAGLARPPLAPEANMVVFAASSGKLARRYLTSDGEHGLFTAALLKHLPAADKNVTFGELEDALRRDVGNASGNAQTPEVFFGKEFSRDKELR